MKSVGLTGRLLGLLLSFFSVTLAHAADVTFAGMAYAGDAASQVQRFPYSSQYEKALKSAGTTASRQAWAAVSANLPAQFSISLDPIAGLKGRDQALVAALVLNSEIVSVERFGDIRKLFVLLRAQALFFDFKSMMVVRSYPISFAYIDNFNRDPSAAEILERVRMVYEGASGKPGLFARYAAAVARASMPSQASRLLQVTKVSVAPEVTAILPDYLKSNAAVYETWAADLVGEAISSRIGVPVVPYSKGHAVGNAMSMRVLDGDVFNLALPKPDYEISVSLNNTKKILYSQNVAGSAYIYGTYASIQIEEPLSGKRYLDTALKNGETKLVPASQTFVDDFPAYYDSLNGMFVKLAQTVAGQDGAWIKSAADAADIDTQISKTKELMNLCK